MTSLSRQDYKGWCILRKTGGSGPLSVGTQIMVPCDHIICNNPTNTTYPLLINADASVSNAVLGKRTPNVTLQTAVKTSWWSANLLNSLLMSSDSDGNTDMYAVGIFDGAAMRVFDGARCAGMTLGANAAGGATGIELPFLARYDSAQPGTPSPTTFTTPTVDPGYLLPVSQINFANTADLVSAVQLQILRGQGYLPFFDQSLYMGGIGSGVATGTMSISQSPTATTTPSSGAILQVGTTGAGVQFACSLNLDNFKRDYMASLGSMADIYSLVDLSGAGNIVVISAM